MGKKLSFSKQLYLDDGINREKLDKLKKKLMDTPVLTNQYYLFKGMLAERVTGNLFFLENEC